MSAELSLTSAQENAPTSAHGDGRGLGFAERHGQRAEARCVRARGRCRRRRLRLRRGASNRGRHSPHPRARCAHRLQAERGRRMARRRSAAPRRRGDRRRGRSFIRRPVRRARRRGLGADVARGDRVGRHRERRAEAVDERAAGPVRDRRGRPPARAGHVRLRPLPADQLVEARRAAREPAGTVEQQQPAGVGLGLPHQHQRADELLGAETTNLSESHEALVAFIEQVAVPSRVATRNAFGEDTPGWTARTSQSIFGGNSWEWNTIASAWYAQHLYEHWAFTQDRTYLEHLAVPADQGDLPVLGGPAEGAARRHPRRAERLVARARPARRRRHARPADHLGPVPELPRVRARRSRSTPSTARPSPTCSRDSRRTRSARWGQLQEWQTDRDDPNDLHRHTSHLFAVYPGRQITAGRPSCRPPRSSR